MKKIFNPPRTKARRRALRNAPTPAESLLWSYLRRRQLAECRFRRQHGIGSYILDFYAPEIRLAIELDGDVHDRPDIHIADHSRQQFIESHDIHVMRIRNDELFESTQQVLARIEEVVRVRRSA